DVIAVPAEGVEALTDLLERAPRCVPGVGVASGRPEGLLGTRATDQDRQVVLDGSRLTERVVHRVEATLVLLDPLAVEEPPQQHHRLVEPVEPLAEARAPGLEAEGLVLPLEPGAADP